MIGNDRLTVANLNRIKMLEAQLDEERQANEELARENDELRGRPSAEKVDALQEMLGEREQQARARAQFVGAQFVGAQFLPRDSLTLLFHRPQLIQLSRKLEESESRENVSKLGNIGDRLSGSFKARTDNSLLDRLGINRF